MKDILKQLEQDLLIGLGKHVSSGECFKHNYNSRLDLTEFYQKLQSEINFDNVRKHLVNELEKEIATKIVNKLITEMGTDIKQLMGKPQVRDDFRFMLRTQVEKILEKLK